MEKWGFRSRRAQQKKEERRVFNFIVIIQNLTVFPSLHRQQSKKIYKAGRDWAVQQLTREYIRIPRSAKLNTFNRVFINFLVCSWANYSSHINSFWLGWRKFIIPSVRAIFPQWKIIHIFWTVISIREHTTRNPSRDSDGNAEGLSSRDFQRGLLMHFACRNSR